MVLFIKCKQDYFDTYKISAALCRNINTLRMIGEDEYEDIGKLFEDGNIEKVKLSNIDIVIEIFGKYDGIFDRGSARIEKIQPFQGIIHPICDTSRFRRKFSVIEKNLVGLRVSCNGNSLEIDLTKYNIENSDGARNKIAISLVDMSINIVNNSYGEIIIIPALPIKYNSTRKCVSIRISIDSFELDDVLDEVYEHGIITHVYGMNNDEDRTNMVLQFVTKTTHIDMDVMITKDYDEESVLNKYVTNVKYK